jgi:tetraacyldisaccharide 4'-kinase
VTRWWGGQGGATGKALDAALLPAEALFRAGTRLRNHAFDRGLLAAEAAPVPVVSVGNIAVGGAGKTPFAAWLAGRLREMGRAPAIALRGYGADEVELHRELNPDVPVFAAARRVEAARAAAAAGCDVVVLDDAFQHRRLARDLDLVLVSVESWRRAPRLLPRGPWREDPAALARADVVVLTRKSARAARAQEVAADVSLLLPGKPVVRCWLAPAGLRSLDGREEHPLAWLEGRSVLAVAALADPAPFLENLRALGAAVEARIFGDHHPFTADDAHHLAHAAAGRTIVMTYKDAVKLRSLLPRGAQAYVLEQCVSVEAGGDVLDAALRRALEARR